MRLLQTSAGAGFCNVSSGASHLSLPEERNMKVSSKTVVLGPSVTVPLQNMTQGPVWPPSEVADRDGNFILVGGFILQEDESGKIVRVPNFNGVLVSKDTIPPLKYGLEDFSGPNLFGAPYRLIRNLDLRPGSSDMEQVLYSLSSGPFFGNFGGGHPKIPGQKDSRFNLNCEPLWNKSILPVGADTPDFYRPSYPLHQMPIWRMDEIPDFLSVGVRVEPDGEDHPEISTHRFVRSPVTLSDYIRAKGDIKITLLRREPSVNAYTHGRLDFSIRELLPNSVFTIFAVHGVSLLPPDDPRFLLAMPIGFPSIVLTDNSGNARASFELYNPFPHPANDPHLNRLAGVVVIYQSDFQSWGGAITAVGTGGGAHTIMGAYFNDLGALITQPSE